MTELNITGDLTVDEIHKIREWNYERRKHMSFEEYMDDVKKGANEVRDKMERVRNEKRSVT